MDKKVPVTALIGGEKIVIGEAVVDENGTITATLMNDYAQELFPFTGEFSMIPGGFISAEYEKRVL